MSYYGYFRDTTPYINKFFKDAYAFSNAFAPASLTFTDSLSLFYSLSPGTHKAFLREKKKSIAESLVGFPNLASVLNLSGYKTAAFVSDEDYAYEWGIGKDFKFFFDRAHYADNNIDFKPFTFSIGTKQLIKPAVNWLENNYKEKFFLFIQAYDMHCPYSPEERFNKLYPMPHTAEIPFTSECFMTKEPVKSVVVNGKKKFILKSYFAYLDKKQIPYQFEKQDLDYLVSRYDAELNQSDSRLEVIFETIKKLNLDKKTVILFMADHGDNLGENGYYMKPASTALGNLHHANLNFPLILKLPGQKTKISQEQLISTIDIAPSLLDILRIPKPVSMQGLSFKNILGTKKEINDKIYAASVRFDLKENESLVNRYYKLEALHDHEWKLMHSAEFDLATHTLNEERYYFFNLKLDPEERVNLFNKKTKNLKKYQLELKQYRKRYILDLTSVPGRSMQPSKKENIVLRIWSKLFKK